jgi:hypothetical protein
MIGLGGTQRIAHHRLRFTGDGIEVAPLAEMLNETLTCIVESLLTLPS